jgi:hypothetical protein
MNVVQKGTEPLLYSTEEGIKVRAYRKLGHVLMSRLLNTEQHHTIKVAVVPTEKLLGLITLE